MKKILIVAISIIALSSCKKDKINETNCEISTANLIGFYKITDVKFSTGNSNLVKVLNNPNFFEQCRKDDVFTFLLNGAFSVGDNATVCNPRDNNYSGTWTLSNGNNLNIIGNINNEKYIIENFTCTTLDLKITNPIPNTTGTYTYIYSLERL